MTGTSGGWAVWVGLGGEANKSAAEFRLGEIEMRCWLSRICSGHLIDQLSEVEPSRSSFVQESHA